MRVFLARISLVRHLGVACIAIAAFSLGVLAADKSNIKWNSSYPDEYLTLLESAEGAFRGTDTEPLIQYLAADFSAYEIRDGQVRTLSEGRDAVLARLGKSFATLDRRWLGSDVERIGHIGNTFIQVKYDNMETPDGKETLPSIVIIQFKDKQRWREWRIIPEEL